MPAAVKSERRLLDELIERIQSLEPEEQLRIAEEAVAGTASKRWLPNPGPQTEAYFCPADELLYGGEPGGGKSDLLIGLSLEEHETSLILRRTNAEALKLFPRYEEILGHSNGKNEQRGWKLPGRTIDIGGCQLEKDKQKRKGIAHSLKGFDELTDFTKTQYLFIINWCRSTNPHQRCRIVSTTNAPTSVNGIWVIERWAPWLDPTHPKPAKDGEIRWFLQINEDEEREVDGPGPYEVDGKKVRALSRTFIRSKLEDNPDLAEDGNYASRLNSAQGELRALARGDFSAALEDKIGQCIPTQWVREAQQRWTPQRPAKVPQCAIGADMSGGGNDPFVLAPRHDGWYDKLVVIPGKTLPIERMGKHCAGIIVSHRRDKSEVVVDMGGGYGGGTYETLRENDIPVVMFKGGEKSIRRTEHGNFGFANKRTEVYWKFREALDPSRPGGSPIMLDPNDLELLAELCTPTFEEKAGVIHLMTKEDVCELLGRSPNKADAVVMAWSSGARYITDGRIWERDFRERGPRGMRHAVVMGRANNRTRR